MNIGDFFKSNWLKIVSYVLVLVVGVALGWGTKPDVIQEKVQIVQVEKQIVVEKEVVRIEVVKVKDTQVIERWHREKTEEKKPDGTVITKEVEDKNIDSIVKEKENSTEVKIVEVEKQIVVEKEVIKEVKVGLAQWHVSVGGALGPQLDPLRLSGTFDVAVERRIVGPFFLGLTANIGTDFQKVSGFGGGLRIGAEF